MKFDIRQLLSGIGILLFGMTLFEESIRYLGGNKLKSIIKKYTNTGRKAIFTGFWTTSVLQSSSLLSLLILAFAGAGILELSSSIGLIFGSNVGSPVLPLITAYVGFGTFKLSALALPMIAVGGLSLIFLKNEKRMYIAKLLIGFGFLFLGLHFMKESMEAMKATFDLEKYTNLSLRGFGIFGIIATLAIQSSGALGILVLTALDGGIISFPASIAIGMGANVGTTFTAIIGAMGGNRIKKQIALSHVMFNVLSAIIGIIFFWQYIGFVNNVLGLEGNPILANARLNVVFNASTVVLFGFFLSPFTKMILGMIPNKKEKSTLKVLSLKKRTKGAFIIPTLYALHKDIASLISMIQEYHLFAFHTNANILQKKEKKKKNTTIIPRDGKKHEDLYKKIKITSDILLEYLLPIKLHKLNKKESRSIEYLEKSIYACIKSAKSLKNITEDLRSLEQSDDNILQELYEQIKQHQFTFYHHVENIIDMTYDKENFKELSSALKDIKENHHQFIHHISKYIAKKQITDIAITTLINLDNYLYTSDKNLVTAVQYTYLTNGEEKIFQKIKE